MSQALSLPPSIATVLPPSITAMLPHVTSMPSGFVTMLPESVKTALPPSITNFLPPPPGPPYPGYAAQLGGMSSKSVDVPIASVFLVLYLIAACANLYLFFNNMKHKIKFLLNEFMGSLCLIRVLTMSLRITEAYYPHNVRLGMTTSIFVLAGVLLLYVINLVFAERIIRAIHPKFGWGKPFTITMKILLWLLPAILVLLITMFVLQFYTLDADDKQTYFDIQRAGQCYLMFISILPLLILPASFAFPYEKSKVEHFGSGGLRGQVLLVVASSLVLTLGCTFRISVAFEPVRLFFNPAWYQSKACFWIFNFVTELTAIFMYLIFRVDKRFFIPNKSRQAGGYAAAYAALEASRSREDSTSSLEKV